MADPPPPDILDMPVGFRFHPTDQEIIGHYLHHKFLADDTSINDTIPEIGTCKYEPWDLLDWAASASSTKFDEFQCFFFSPYDYKYSNSNRLNRTTLCGFWKVTGRDRDIKQRGTNNVIGTKRTLVFHKREGNRGIKTNWVIHEYHYLMLAHVQRTHVLCWLKKNIDKKPKEKNYHGLDDKQNLNNHVIIGEEYQANACMNPDEYHFVNRCSMIQTPFPPNGTIDSMIQIPPKPNGAIESLIQTPCQPNIATNSILQPIEVIVSLIQAPPQRNKVIESMSQVNPQLNVVKNHSHIPLQPTEATVSLIQAPPRNKVIESMSQVNPQLNGVKNYSQIPLQPTEATVSLIQAPPRNKVIESMSQVNPQLNEVKNYSQIPLQPTEATVSLIQAPPQRNKVIESMSQANPQLNEVINPMIQTNPQLNETINLMIPPLQSIGFIDSMIETHLSPKEDVNSIIQNQLNKVIDLMIEKTFESDESIASKSIIHTETSEPNSTVETEFDSSELESNLFDTGEIDFSSIDTGEYDFTSPLQLSPIMDESVLFETLAASDMNWYESIETHLQPDEDVNPIIQKPHQLNKVIDSESDESIASIIHTETFEPNATVETEFDSSELESYLFDTGELEFSSIDTGEYDFTSLLQLSQIMDEP